MPKFHCSIYLFFMIYSFCISPLRGQEDLNIANLGNFILENGKVIANCRLGYRTYGTLNQDRSNAVLFPAWLGGTSDNLKDFVGTDKFVDDSRWFVITVDPIGNGISSSPSNSNSHDKSHFPRYTIRDMVNTEHFLLTEVLGIDSLYGVIGMSMGGHEVFEWIVSYPEFVKKAVSIVGTPRMTSYELLYWQTQLEVWDAFQNCVSCNSKKFLSLWLALFAYSKKYQNDNIQPGEFDQFMNQIGEIDFNINDYSSQIRAIMSHDVIAKYGGTIELAASRVKADLMAIVATEDLICNPKPAIDFADIVGGQIQKLSSPCGHISFVCESKQISELVRKFFSDKSP